MKVLGYEIKKGNFKDSKTGNIIDYHNVIIHFAKEGENIKGVCTEEMKIKYNQFIDMLNNSKIGIDNFIGMDVNIYCDRFGNPIHIAKV